MKNSLKQYSISILIKLLFCATVYGLMINQFLFNRQDGIWNGTYHMGGDWDLSLGRWAIRYLDALHFGVSVHPFSTVLTLLFFVVGTCFLIDLFQIRIGSVFDYLISGVFLGNMVICASISYLYYSNTYGLSFMLSMLSIWLIHKGTEQFITFKKIKVGLIISFIGAVICISVVLGLYQAYLGCIVLTALVFLVYLLYRGVSLEYIRNYIVGGCLTGICGAFMYEIILNIELLRWDVEMSSYNGANTLSLENIFSNLAMSISRSYKIFTNYFRGVGSKWNLFAGDNLFLLVAILCVLVVLIILLVHQNILVAAIALFAMFLMPIAANIVIILIPTSAYQEWQTAPCAMVFPLIMCIFVKQICEHNFLKLRKTFKIGFASLSLFIMWGSIYQTQIDQEALRQGTVAVETIGQSILSTLYSGNMYSADQKYAVIGEPCNNPMIHLNDIYYRANSYAKIAGEYWKTSLDARTWSGIFYNLCGVNLPRCDDSDFESLLVDQRVLNMPIFPADRSIQKIDDIVVIRIS